MTNYKDFSHLINGLWPDVLAQYGIEVPKMAGQNSINHPCPLCGGHDRAHWREVGGRLALYCRSCAPDSMHSVERVIMEYAGIDFKQLSDDLAKFINHAPIEAIKKAQSKKAIQKTNLPVGHMEDRSRCATIANQAKTKEYAGVKYYFFNHATWFEMIDCAGDLLNFATIDRIEYANADMVEKINYLAGGISYGAFTPIKVNDNNRWFAVRSSRLGLKLALEKSVNVAICWNSFNIKYVYWNRGELNIVPVLTPSDDLTLVDHGVRCGWFENNKLTKKN